MLATASRDRLLHIFDINRGFQLVQTLDDHSSSITAVRFSHGADKLISCGADKGIIFRYLNPQDQCYTTYHNHSGRSTVFDMALDIDELYIATVTGERRLFVFNIVNGKPVRVCKPETADEAVSGTSAENSGGSLINIDLDPFSGTFAVTSGSDRCIRLFDLTNSACIFKVCAHAELITGVKFIRSANESLRVVSTCSDGTIFVWKIAGDIIAKMKARRSEVDSRAKQMVLSGKSNLDDGSDDGGRAAARGVGGANNNNVKKMRSRQMSTAAVIRPTPSLSQLARQGERKTFSSVSPAETKYDELYRKIALRKGQTEDNNNNSNTADNKDAPSVETSNDAGEAGKQNDKSSGKPPSKRDGQKAPEGRLERLFSGVPTTGVRERVYSHVNSNAAANRYGSEVSRLNPLRQGPSGLRTNQVLRRQVSRDVLIKRESGPTNGSKDTPRAKIRFEDAPIQQRRPSTLAAAENSPNGRGENQVLMSKVSNTNLRARTIESAAKSRAEIEEDDQQTSDSEILSQSPRPENSMDDDGQEAGDERDAIDDEDDDDEEDDSEEVIFITPPLEPTVLCEPCEVTDHDIIQQEDQPAYSLDDGQKSPSVLSDDEKNNASGSDPSNPTCEEEEEDSSSSEENADEAIIQAINSREAPRMTQSISRTTSMSTTTRSPNFDLAAGLDKRKLEKSKKRQSLTARYLSSLNGRSSGGHLTVQQALLLPVNNINNDSRKDDEKAELFPALQPEQSVIPLAPLPPASAAIPSSSSSSSDTKNEEDTTSNSTDTASDPLKDQLDSMMADLDGAAILLDTVLETFTKARRSVSDTGNHKETLDAAKVRLDGIVSKITQALTDSEEISSPSTATVLENSTADGLSDEVVKMLDKYSAMLVRIVEKKISSSMTK